jgi:hypothetical protein
MIEQVGGMLVPPRYTEPEQSQTVLPALESQLAGALRDAEIAHCRYPGSTHPSGAAAAQRTIDLLVDASDPARLAAVMAQLGCKRAVAGQCDRIPDTDSFVGADPRGGLVHVRAHYRLLIGDWRATHYRLPIERPLLQSVQRGHPFPIPAPTFELVILALRAVVGGPVVGDALDHLTKATSRAAVHQLLADLLPCIDAALFDDCVAAWSSETSSWRRRALRRTVTARLNAYRRMPSIPARLADVAHKLITLGGCLGTRQDTMRLAGGGKVIALIGGDGAGKSTCARELSRWLSPLFDVQSVNLGWPRRSLASLAVGGILRTSALIATLLGAEMGERVVWNEESNRFPGYVALLRHVCNARDRHASYVRIHHFAEDGGIALCERYPIMQSKPIDGSRVRAAATHAPNQRLAGMLRDAEEQYYRRFVPPDQAIVLLVDPDVAVYRKPDEASKHVRRHAQVIWETDWSVARALVVDAGRPLPDVLTELKAAVWAEL